MPSADADELMAQITTNLLVEHLKGSMTPWAPSRKAALDAGFSPIASMPIRYGLAIEASMSNRAPNMGGHHSAGGNPNHTALAGLTPKWGLDHPKHNR